MNLLKRIFNFYIFSNIHVAFATFSLTKITLLTYSIKDNIVPFFVLFATLVSYNLIRFYKIDSLQSWFFQFYKKNRKALLALAFTALILLIFFSLQLSFKALLTLIPFGIFTLFYVVPFPIKKGNSIALRSISFLKLFLIAISWAGVTVLFPLLNYNIPIDQNVVLVFLQRLLFVIVITIPFDIRDALFDKATLKTLPQVLGVKSVKRLGLFLMMLFLGIELLKSNLISHPFRVHLYITILSLLFLFRANQNQSKYYSAFFVESIPIAWLCIYLI